MVRGKNVVTTTADTFFFFLSNKRGNWKIWGEKSNKDKKCYYERKKEVVRRGEKIFEMSIYYYMIYK